MKASVAKCGVDIGIVLILVLMSHSLRAEGARASLSGTVTNFSGAGVRNAKVSIKNLDTRQLIEIQRDASGVYTAPGLTAAHYEIPASAAGFEVKVTKTTLAAESQQTVDLALVDLALDLEQAKPQAPGSNQSAPQENLPNAPSTSKTAPSLEDLGFQSTESQGNAKEQALLDKRTHMQDSSTHGFDHDHSLDRCDPLFPERRRQEHQHDRTRLAPCSGWGGWGFVLHHRLLRHPCAQGCRN